MKVGNWRGPLLMSVVALVAVGAGIAWWSFWDRVDPGNAGVLIDYCSGTSKTITDARYVFVDPRCKRLAEYPTAEYTIEMVGAGSQNDQSVPCVMQDQQTIRMDTATAWSVDPQRVGDLYRMRPDVALSGSSNGQDIATLVVRSEVRAGIRDACTKFGWEDAYGAHRAEYELEAERAVQARLEPVGIKVRTVSIRGMDPSPQLDALIEARLNGQRAVEQAQFEQAQAERQGQAQLAQQRAAASAGRAVGGRASEGTGGRRAGENRGRGRGGEDADPRRRRGVLQPPASRVPHAGAGGVRAVASLGRPDAADGARRRPQSPGRCTDAAPVESEVPLGGDVGVVALEVSPSTACGGAGRGVAAPLSPDSASYP